MKTVRYAFFIICVLVTAADAQITATFTPSSFFGSLNFGNVQIGKTAKLTVVIHRTDTANSAGMMNCSITPPVNTSIFSISTPTSFSLSPGASDTVVILFSPTVVGKAPADSFKITHNAATSFFVKNPVVYTLSGAGIVDTFPKITVSANAFINIGTVAVGKTGVASFTIKNTSDTIRKLIGNVGTCFTKRFAVDSGGGAFSLDTGKSVKVVVGFTPDTSGQFTDSVIITDNAASPNNRIKLTFVGTGVIPSRYPKLTIGGVFGSVNFRTDTVGMPPRTASFTITNSSDSARTLTGTVLSPKSPFSIVSGAGPFSIDSGKSITVQLAFTAVSIGTFRDTIVIANLNTDPANPPVTVPLVGVGYVITGSHINVSPGSLNFGTVSAGTAGPTLTLRVKNSADSLTDTLRGTVISPSSLAFVITSGGGNFILPQHDSLHVSVQMATNKAGNFSDSVVINSNSNDNAAHLSIRISGTVVNLGVHDGAESAETFSAFPNPFSNKVLIGFTLQEESSLSLAIVDVLGREVYSVPETVYQSGKYEMTWNAQDLPAGKYFCVIRKGLTQRTLQLILQK